MPQSKRDKSRKEKLDKFKKSKQMTKAPEMKPFRQIPTWDSNAKITMTGSEFEQLYQFINIFVPALTATQQVFTRNVQNGTIKLAYEYEDGSPVADEDLKAYTEKLNSYFKARMEAETKKALETSAEADLTEDQVADLAPKEPESKLVSLYGEKLADAVKAEDSASL